MVWDRTAAIFMTRLYETGLHPFFDKMVWDRTASIFMTRWRETGLHSFLWQDCMRQDCIHFYDKMAWDRTAFIFMTRLFEAGLHPFLWQDGMRQDCIHFYDKIVWDRTAFIFMTRWHETGLHSFFKTSQHKTGAHPFYIGMYIHIYTHIYVHIYTSQKECLCIFTVYWRTSWYLTSWEACTTENPVKVHWNSDTTTGSNSEKSWILERLEDMLGLLIHRVLTMLPFAGAAKIGKGVIDQGTST